MRHRKKNVSPNRNFQKSPPQTKQSKLYLSYGRGTKIMRVFVGFCA